jgi:hypothetical protein
MVNEYYRLQLEYWIVVVSGKEIGGGLFVIVMVMVHVRNEDDEPAIFSQEVCVGFGSAGNRERILSYNQIGISNTFGAFA